MNVDVIRPGGAVVGTFTFNTTVGDMLVRGSTVAANMSLPAGRWQVVTTLMGTGSAQAAQTAQSADTTLGSPGVIASAVLNIKAYRPFTAPSQELRAQVQVQRHNGTRWVPYASGLGVAAVAVAGAASTTKRIGVAGLFLFTPDWVGPIRSWWQTGMDRAAEAGFNFLRLALPQPAIGSKAAPVSPMTTWDAAHLTLVDNFYNDATARGLTIVANIAGGPCWASSQAGKTCTTRDGTNAAQLYPPTSWQDMQDLAKAACDRYAFEAVEPYNEPNNTTFALTGYSDADHVTRHQRMRAGIQASAHPCPLLGMVTSLVDTPWMDRMYTAGIAPYMDAVCVHPYPVDMIPASPTTNNPWHQPTMTRPYEITETTLGMVPVEAIDMTYSNMVSHSDGAKPVWVTECGVETHMPGQAPQYAIAPISAARRSIELDAVIRQAARISYLGGFTIYALQDYGTDGYGLCDPQWNRKPSFTAVKAAISDVRAGIG